MAQSLSSGLKFRFTDRIPTYIVCCLRRYEELLSLLNVAMPQLRFNPFTTHPMHDRAAAELAGVKWIGGREMEFLVD